MGSSGCRADPRHAGDGFQRPLVPRSRFQPRLMPSVRLCLLLWKPLCNR
jgi:hypothetical protein